MRERLVFTSLESQKAATDLIKAAFPTATLWELPQPSVGVFLWEIEVDIDKEEFFEWAVVPHGDIRPIFLCLNLSLELVEMPIWMRNRLKHTEADQIV